MKSLFPSKQMWSDWSYIDRCTYIGTIVGILGLILGALSFIDVTKTENEVTSIKKVLDNAGADSVHVLPNELEFNLNEHSENRTKRFNATIIVQARNIPILMTKKVELLSYQLNSAYFTSENFEKKFEINKVSVSKPSIESASETAIVEIEFDTMFVYVNANTLVWNIDRARGERAGSISVRFYFIYQGNEYSKDVIIPIRFV
ncbi:hypothetical protein THOG11_350008 [Vibrio harveyi]|uniref:hypothetical protein n=2 Tax=Vibrio harveyi TaxID=669 RepID=UPI001EFE0E57|nr:hypothetical protein [Vibrio harveyi]MCG9237535.1 hypothetical protein [Vibrio harveyi]CAH1235012.1 hypothetical protein TH15OA1_560020 [Vibrio harveyi]CAH1568449.1 hypothetical protein THOD03_380008 [Vibrio harveyi]CAH1574569.1 hypothetical protein THOG11_350008 [Vibrio harveyi]